MPTFQFEAMDATGAGDQGRDRSADRRRSPSDDSPDGLLRHQDHRQEEPQEGRRRPAARRSAASSSAASSSQDLTTFTRQLSILQDAGLPILRSLRILDGQSKPGRLKNSLIDICDEIEGGSTLSEAHGQEPQVLQPPVRQHDQGRRGGRCAGSHSAAPGRVPGTVRIAQAQSQRRDDLPGRRRHRRRRHLDVHHDQDRARVRQDLRGLRPRAAGDDRCCWSTISNWCVNYWYLDPRHPDLDLADRSS